MGRFAAAAAAVAAACLAGPAAGYVPSNLFEIECAAHNLAFTFGAQRISGK
jgi:hypothetical protein